MEDKRCEKSRQAPIQFRCKKILPGVVNTTSPAVLETKKFDDNKDLGDSLVSLPPKPVEPLRSSMTEEFVHPARDGKEISKSFLNERVINQSVVADPGDGAEKDSSKFSELSTHVISKTLKDGAIKLPDKYKTLAYFFDRMGTSVRLLGLRKMLSSFQNISAQVEILTRRNFLNSHLAQIKYLFPEAIQIENVLVHDEKQLCMKRDMKITLLSDAIESHLYPDQSVSMALCQAFNTRLLDYINSHPEGADIPEAMLPEAFNLRNLTVLLDTLPEDSSMELPQPTFVDLLSSASHLSSSFHRQFSQKIIVPETQSTQLLATTVSSVPIGTDENKENCSSPQKKDNSCSPIKSPAEVICTLDRCKVSNFSESTPVKFLPISEKLITEAATLTSKPMPSPDENLDTEAEKLSSLVRRSLIYSPSKADGSVSDPTDCKTEQNRAIQYSCCQTLTTKRSLFMEETSGSSTIHQNVVPDIGAGIIEDCKMSQMGLRKRQEMLCCLPDMFDTIRQIFRSANCSLITKQELVHKILSYSLDIEETREVEEQLGLLEELVPDWFFKKIESSGDFLYCIKQTSDPEAIRTRLIEAA